MKPIDGYEGRYSITELGEIYSHLSNKYLTLQLDKNGYHKIGLYTGGRGSYKCYRVARLVAHAYLKNIIGKDYVNHIDGNKLNDIIGNLEWVTAQEIARHAVDTGLSVSYDRTKSYNRTGIVESNKRRRKWFGTKKEYMREYYYQHKEICGS